MDIYTTPIYKIAAWQPMASWLPGECVTLYPVVWRLFGKGYDKNGLPPELKQQSGKPGFDSSVLLAAHMPLGEWDQLGIGAIQIGDIAYVKGEMSYTINRDHPVYDTILPHMRFHPLNYHKQILSIEIFQNYDTLAQAKHAYDADEIELIDSD